MMKWNHPLNDKATQTMHKLVWTIAALLGAIGATVPTTAQELKAGAAAEILSADDAMVIGGGIGPGKARGQEGELRASALVIEDARRHRIALIACDVLMIERDVLDRAARRIEAAAGIPFDHILINATHTHHAPTTVTIHGYERDESFTRQVEEKIVQSAVKAAARLAPASFLFGLGEESSVGKNSRLLLGDGTIYWVGTSDDAVRPTGPFDPELPVLAFRRRDGGLEAVLFNHSTHTIGTQKPGVRSPSFYGLAAQELEKEKGGTFLFFEGASGSTHNLGVTAVEATYRIRQAVANALDAARPRPVNEVAAIRKEITVKVRHFDEDADQRVVSDYCNKRIKDPAWARSTIETFRGMRRQIAHSAGRIAQDLGPGRSDRRRGDRGRPRRVLHDAGPGDQARLAVPLYVRLRAGERLYRLHPRPRRLRSGRLSDLDRPPQLPRAGHGRGDRRGGRRGPGTAPSRIEVRGRGLTPGPGVRKSARGR